MAKMEKLIAQIAAIKSRLKEIDEKQASIEKSAEDNNAGAFTAEQRTEYDALQAEYDTKSAELQTAEADLNRLKARQARKPVDTTVPRKSSHADSGPLVNPVDDDGNEQQANRTGRVTIPATVKRGGTLRNFRGEVNGRDPHQRAYLFGMFMLAKASHDLPGRFRFSAAVDFARDRWGLSSESGGDMASVLVPEEFGVDLIDLREQYGVARQIFKRRPMSSDTRTDPRRKGGLSAVFVGEGAAGTESTKEWDPVRLTAKKLMVISRYTNELNMDSVISIGDDLAGEISYAFANKEDECAFNGDGTSTYGGITGVRTALAAAAGSPTTTSAGGVIVGSGNLYSELTLADFNLVMGKLPQYAFTPNTRWVASAAVYHGTMEKLALAAGGATANEVVNGVPQFRFLGYPVAISQVMPVTAGNSQVCVLFGDFTQGASFGDRQQDSISFSEHASVGGQSLWERDEIGIRGTERFDINVHDVGNATTAGPIVGLQTLNA